MFQIGLTLALSIISLVASWLWSNRQRHDGTAPQHVRRVFVALEKAGHATLRRRLAQLPLLLGTVAIPVVAANWWLHARTPSVPLLVHLLLPPLHVVLGAVTTILLAWYCLRHRSRHAYSVWIGATISNERALASAWSAATFLLITAEAAGMLCVFGIHQVAEWLIIGVMAPESAVSGASPMMATSWTAYFGVGAAVAAFWLQHMGSVCVGAASLGTKSALLRHTDMEHADPRNPAVLIDAIARQMGETLPRVFDVFATSTLVSTLTLLLLQLNASGVASQFAAPAVTLPLLFRGFGIVAAVFGVVSLRAPENDKLERSLLRSQVVVELVFAGAITGCIFWLVGVWSPVIVLAVLFGLFAPSLTAYVRRLRLDRTTGERAGAKGQEGDAYWHKLQELGRVLGRVTLLPATAYAMVLLLSLFGLGSLDPHLSLLAFLIALGAPSAVIAWRGAGSLAMDLHATAQLGGNLGRLATTAEVQRRQHRLSEVLSRAVELSEPVRIDGGALVCGLVAAILGWTAPYPSSLALVPSLLTVTLLACVPGALALADSLRGGARCAQAQISEILRQVRGLRRDGATTQVPTDFVPSYRSCVELLARDAASGGFVPAVLAVALPLLMAVPGARTENSPGSQATLLAMYLSVVVAVGLAIAHAGQAEASAASLARRDHPGGAPSRTGSDSGSFELVGFLQRTVVVSIPLLLKVATLIALALAAILA